MKIILASQSPRRRELLEQIGLDFAVLVSEVEERITEKDPEAAVCQLDLQKGKSGGRTAGTGDSGDRCGYGGGIRGQNHGKTEKRGGGPPDVETAAGKYSDSVFTGTALICTGEIQDETEVFARETKVSMYSMTEEEIAWYISTGEPMDKAGAYGIRESAPYSSRK